MSSSDEDEEVYSRSEQSYKRMLRKHKKRRIENIVSCYYMYMHIQFSIRAWNNNQTPDIFRALLVLTCINPSLIDFDKCPIQNIVLWYIFLLMSDYFGKCQNKFYLVLSLLASVWTLFTPYFMLWALSSYMLYTATVLQVRICTGIGLLCVIQITCNYTIRILFVFYNFVSLTQYL